MWMNHQTNLGQRWELLSWWAPPSFAWWRSFSRELKDQHHVQCVIHSRILFALLPSILLATAVYPEIYKSIAQQPLSFSYCENLTAIPTLHCARQHHISSHRWGTIICHAAATVVAIFLLKLFIKGNNLPWHNEICTQLSHWMSTLIDDHTTIAEKISKFIS